MSFVTDLILVIPCLGHGDRLHAIIEGHNLGVGGPGHMQALVHLNRACRDSDSPRRIVGGEKHLQIEIYTGAINYLGADELGDLLAKIRAELDGVAYDGEALSPAVRLMMNREDSETMVPMWLTLDEATAWCAERGERR